MLDMDDAPCPVDGPIRSRFRGLSWDKKHQGWRVRIHYSGKQRHVGRYENDITAAKAYDKAAVYLYGANAITNFGLAQVAEDPTEVSAFIVLAKEQADQEQAVRGQQQRLHTCTAESHLVKGAQLLPGSPLLPGTLLMQQQQVQYSAGAPGAPYPQSAVLPHMDMAHLAWQQQQQAYGASSSIHCRTQAVQQQVWGQPAPLSQQVVMFASPAAASDALSSSMSSMSSASTLSTAAAGTSAMSSPASAASSTSYMLCTGPGGQHMLVPIAAAGALPAMYAATDDSAMLMAQQQLMAAQEQLAGSFAAQNQQQQQQGQHILFNGAAASLPMQLSVQPQLTPIAVHMAAAQLPPQQLGSSNMPVAFAPAGTDCSGMAAVSAAAAAAALVNATATSAGLTLTQTAGPTAPHSAAAAAVSAPGAFVGNMFQGLDCYTSATVAAAAAAAADRIASPMRPQLLQQQQQQQQVHQVLLASSRPACGGLADSSSNSSSSSPIIGMPTALLEAPGMNATLDNASLGQMAGRGAASVIMSLGMSFCGKQLAASPTFSNSSRRSFGVGERMMY